MGWNGAEPQPTSEPHGSRLEGVRVLVVDDDADARELVRIFLEESGCEVTLASDVEEVMQILARQRFDVLISDIGMPGQDGYDLIRRVRGLPAALGGGMPAAALTAFARPEDRKRALSAGFSVHLPKPMNVEDLMDAVAWMVCAPG